MEIKRLEAMLMGALGPRMGTGPRVSRVGLDYNDHKVTGHQSVEQALAFGAYRASRWAGEEARRMAGEADSVWCLGWSSATGSVRASIASPTLAGCLNLAGLCSEDDTDFLAGAQKQIVSLLRDATGSLSMEYEDRWGWTGGLARAIGEGEYGQAKWVDEHERRRAEEQDAAWLLCWRPRGLLADPRAVCGATLSTTLAAAGVRATAAAKQGKNSAGPGGGAVGWRR